MRRMRIMFNPDMLNGLVAIILSFFAPMLAFIPLFFKIPLLIFIYFYIATVRRKELIERRKPEGEG